MDPNTNSPNQSDPGQNPELQSEMPAQPNTIEPNNLPPVDLSPTQPQPVASLPTESNAAEEPSNLFGQVVVGGQGPSQTVVSSVSPPNMPAPKKKRITRKTLLISLIALVVLVGGASAMYFGYYMNPSVILSESLSNSSKGYFQLLKYANQQSKISYPGYQGSGSYNLKSGGLSTDGTINFVGDNKGNSDSSADIGYGSGRLKAELITAKTATTSSTPDLYFKLSGLSGVAATVGLPPQISQVLNQYDGKWITADHTLLQNLSPPNTGTLLNFKLPSSSQYLDELQAFGKVNQQFLFTTNKSKSVTTVIKKVGAETISGHKTYHYLMGLNKANIKKYITAQQAALKSSKLNGWLSQYGLQSDVTSAFKSMQASANNLSSKDRFDLWVDSSRRIVYKIQIHDTSTSNPTVNYLEVGLDYKGGNSYPFYILNNSSDNGSQSQYKLVLTLNSKSNSINFILSYNSTGSVTASFNLNINAKPTQTAPKISAPTGALPLSQVLNQLGLSNLITSAVPGSSLSGVQAKANDTTRQADIRSLQTQLEVFFAEKGYYPSFTEFNSASWRKTNMPSLDNNALEDPDGKSTNLVTSPAAKAYSYRVTNSVAASCEADATKCTHYELTATLSTGQPYSVTNLD